MRICIQLRPCKETVKEYESAPARIYYINKSGWCERYAAEMWTITNFQPQWVYSIVIQLSWQGIVVTKVMK